MALGAGLLLNLVGARGPEAGTDGRVFESMSLEQRVGQLFLASFRGFELSEGTRRFVDRVAPGGVVLYRTNTSTPATVARLNNALQAVATGRRSGGVGLLVAIDMEGGAINRFFRDRGFTPFPSALQVAATGRPDNAAAVGRAMAEELRAVGINMNLAPVADLAAGLRNPLHSSRAFGSDPEAVGRMVAAFVRGSQRAGVIATAKHFPGHGAASSDSHKDLPEVERGLEQLEEFELVPFRQAVRAGVGAVMAAHVWFSAFEPRKRLPASLSESVLTGLLRVRLGFDGLVVTDALDMRAIEMNYTLAEAARMAIEAGADLVTFGSSRLPGGPRRSWC